VVYDERKTIASVLPIEYLKKLGTAKAKEIAQWQEANLIHWTALSVKPPATSTPAKSSFAISPRRH
jgi:hypothetical protein